MTLKKMIVPIIIAAVVLVGLIIGIMLLSQGQNDDPAATPTPTATAETGTTDGDVEAGINPFLFAREDVTDVRIKNPKGELHITRTSDGKYVVEGHEDVPVNRNKVLDPIYIFTNMTLQDEIQEQDVSDLSAFGLAEPQITATYTAGDGDIRTIYLGDELFDKSGYYMKIEGDDRVFAVWASMYATLNVNVGSLRDIAVFDTKPAAITEVVIDTPAQQLTITKESNRFSEWLVKGPKYQRMADGTKLAGMLAQVARMKPEELVEELNESNMAEYGLDKPTGTITVRQTTGDVILWLGGEESANTLYCMGTAKDAVYKINKGLVDFTKFTPFSLSYNGIYVPVKSEVSSITVAQGAQSQTLTAGSEEFEAFYKQFLAIKLYAEVEAGDKLGDEMGTVTFAGHAYSDVQASDLGAGEDVQTAQATEAPKSSDTVIVFYQVDERKVAFRINDDPAYFAVRPDSVKEMMALVFGE